MASFAIWSKESVNIESALKYFLRPKFKSGAKRELGVDWK